MTSLSPKLVMTTLRAPLGAIALVTVLCMPAQAVPLSARWGVSVTPFTTAVETELLFPGTSLGLSSRLGAAGTPNFRSTEVWLDPYGNWWTTWGHYTRIISPEAAFGGLVGLSKSWFFRGAPIPFRTWYSSEQPLVTFLGVFYQHDWDRTWVRLCPSITMVLPPQTGYPSYEFWEASVLGPSLLEFGIRLDDASDLRIRTSLTPLTYTRAF